MYIILHLFLEYFNKNLHTCLVTVLLQTSVSKNKQQNSDHQQNTKLIDLLFLIIKH